MEVYINSPGTYLKKKDEMFELELEGQKTKVSPKKVKSIVISTRALITTDAIALAVRNNIDIVMVDEFGDPYGRFWHAQFGSTAAIRRKQIEIFESEQGVEIAKAWVLGKIHHAANHLKAMKAKRESKVEEISEFEKAISSYGEKIAETRGHPDQVRHTIMGYEGNASKAYYKALSFLIPEPYKFKGRSFRPARDEFNCMINYGFGILYNRIEKACIIAGLDPNLGILHTDNYNKTSLVFDIIEGFRYLAIVPVFRLFTRKKINKAHFEKMSSGFTLNKDGKKIVAQAVTEELDKRVLYSGRRITQADTIQFECHKLAARLLSA